MGRDDTTGREGCPRLVLWKEETDGRDGDKQGGG
jgi:hypothetical protein